MESPVIQIVKNGRTPEGGIDDTYLCWFCEEPSLVMALLTQTVEDIIICGSCAQSIPEAIRNAIIRDCLTEMKGEI